MYRQTNIFNCDCFWPSKPLGLVEFIGGSYFASKPKVTYKTFIDKLLEKDLAVHAWTYIPRLDHQSQANNAWKDLRKARINLEKRIGNEIQYTLKIGHSLGSKLHLLSPDGGRKGQGFISIGFNNFGVKDSIPLIKELLPKIGLKSEFYPSPIKTLEIISSQYVQPKNLLISFTDDKIDESRVLLRHLNLRRIDSSELIFIEGNHLTPVSMVAKSKLVRKTNYLYNKIELIDQLIEIIFKWSDNASFPQTIKDRSIF
tara:strand:+ start:1247 stop:2017 length:771 start_codon:yes stop_codon:yes gene_type:complete